MRANPFTLFIIGHWLSVQSENINGWKLAVQNLSHLGTEETTLSQIKERRQPGLVRLSRWIFKRVCLWRFIRVLAFNLCQFWLFQYLPLVWVVLIFWEYAGTLKWSNICKECDDRAWLTYNFLVLVFFVFGLANQFIKRAFWLSRIFVCFVFFKEIYCNLFKVGEINRE
jgi:hypothetical protein